MCITMYNVHCTTIELCTFTIMCTDRHTSMMLHTIGIAVRYSETIAYPFILVIPKTPHFICVHLTNDKQLILLNISSKTGTKFQKQLNKAVN